MDDRDLREISEDLEEALYEYEYPVLRDMVAAEEGDDVEDTLPTRLSMRKSLLKVNGRRKGLNSMWDVRRFDSPWVRSRNAGHPCNKDDRTYRPWQRDEMKTIRGVPDNDFNDQYDFLQGILQSEYEDSKVLVEEGV